MLGNSGYEGLYFFIGIVEDIADPKKLGRVKVRMINEYSNRVDSEDIPWAQVLMPVTSGSFLGVGASPTGIVPGSRVIGMFLDGSVKSKPMVMGTLPIISEGDESKHSVSRQARGLGAVDKEYLTGLGEPETEYAAEYPYNNVTTSRSGHVIEIDDTPEAERIHVYHKSGAYIEIFPDGTIVTKSPKDNVEITVGDKVLASSEGDITIIANEGEIRIAAEKDVSVVSSNGAINILASTINMTDPQ